MVLNEDASADSTPDLTKLRGLRLRGDLGQDRLEMQGQHECGYPLKSTMMTETRRST